MLDSIRSFLFCYNKNCSCRCGCCARSLKTLRSFYCNIGDISINLVSRAFRHRLWDLRSKKQLIHQICHLFTHHTMILPHIIFIVYSLDIVICGRTGQFWIYDKWSIDQYLITSNALLKIYRLYWFRSMHKSCLIYFIL